jgi:hypothetical protein
LRRQQLKILSEIAFNLQNSLAERPLEAYSSTICRHEASLAEGSDLGMLLGS